MLEMFNMTKERLVTTFWQVTSGYPLVSVDEISRVPYVSVAGSLMYVMSALGLT